MIALCIVGLPTLTRERMFESFRPPAYRWPAVVLMWVASIALALALVVKLTGLPLIVGSSPAPVMQLEVYSAETGKLLGHCRARRIKAAVVADPRLSSSEVAHCTGLRTTYPKRVVIVDAARWRTGRPSHSSGG